MYNILNTPQNPDINLIENLWVEIAKNVEKLHRFVILQNRWFSQ